MLRKILIRVPILLLFLAVAAVAFSHPALISESALAPLASDEDYISSDNNSYDAYLQEQNDIEEPEPEPEPELEPEPEPEEICTGYITVYLDESEIFWGDLILINHYHGFVIPEDLDLVYLTGIVSENLRLSHDDHMLHSSIIEPLNEMIDAFYAETGRNTAAIVSGFRDTERQAEILEQRTRLLGRTEALRWVAEPGHSEHHAGLAVDLGVFSGGEFRTFLGTGVYSWFYNNAHYFGFILRFPANRFEVTQTAFEPWHFRYVGHPHAQLMFTAGLVLEEYIEFIMTHPPYDSFMVSFDDYVFYEIFFTRNLQIDVPVDSEFTVSGNNIDGFIVTITHHF